MTLMDHKSIFNKDSTCYSELWQLPYQKPACQLVINPMHHNYEMLIPVHFWLILLLTSADVAALFSPKPAFLHNFVTIDKNDAASNNINKTEVKQVSAIHRLLTEVLGGTTDEAGLALLQKCLMDKNTKALIFICNDLHTTTSCTKTHDIDQILQERLGLCTHKMGGFTYLSTINIY